MITSNEDARLLFDKWKQESVPIRIKLISAKIIFEGVGHVQGFSLGALELGGESWSFTVPLDGVEYSFSDPREIPVAAVRAVEAEKYELGLSLHMPDGDSLALMALKTPDPSLEPEAE